MNNRFLPIGFFLGLLVLLLLGGGSRFLGDPGTFWHIRCGNLMLDRGEWITQDPFSFTFGGQPWYPHGWLGEVIMALLHRVGEFDALLLASCLLLAGLYSWLGSKLLATGLNTVLVLAILGLTVAASASHFHARPHILTMLYLAILIYQLQAVETGRITRLWWLMPLLVIWANTHGGVLAGVASFGFVLVGWLAAWAIGWPSPVRSTRDAVEVISLGLAAVLTLFVNPYGPLLVQTIVELTRMPELPRIIQEHAPLEWTDPANWPLIGCGVVYLFALAGLREKPRVCWLLPLVWILLGISRVRHGSLFCVIMLLSLADFFPRTYWARWLATNRPDFYDAANAVPPSGRSIAVLALVLLATGLGLQAFRLPVPVLGTGIATLDPQKLPLTLLPVMHQQPCSASQPARLFNELNYGGFVIYFTPQYRNFVDDRCELYGGAWLERYVIAERSGPAAYLAEMQATYGAFEYALTIRGSGFDQCFAAESDSWDRLAQTEMASFYRRK